MVKALLLTPQVRKASVNPAHALHRVLIGIAAKEENKEAEVNLYQTYTYYPFYLSHSVGTSVICLRATVMKTTK